MIKDRIEKSWLKWISGKWIDKNNTTESFCGGYVSALRDFENFCLESEVDESLALDICNLMIDFKE